MAEETPFFSRLDDVTIRFFEKAAVRRRFPKNTILFSKGDESDSLYIVCSGKAHVIARDPLGKEIVLGVIGPGSISGRCPPWTGRHGRPRSSPRNRAKSW